MGISFYPNSARLYKIGGPFGENGHCALEVLAAQADFGDIADVRGFGFDARNRGGCLE